MAASASVAAETEHLIEERIELLEWTSNGDLGIKVEDKVRPKNWFLRRGEEILKLLLLLVLMLELGLGFVRDVRGVREMCEAMAISPARWRERERERERAMD